MAIQLEFLNLVMPISVLNQKYTGGFAGYLEQHSRSFGRVLWHDDALIRLTGAMDPEMIDIWFEAWGKLGFQSTEMIDGKTVWKDFCIVDSSGFSDHDCPWIVVDGAERVAWLRGTERGEIIGRELLRPDR